MGSKQTLLILLPSTNNTEELWLLAKDSSAVLPPLSSHYFLLQLRSTTRATVPVWTFCTLQWQSKTVKFHKAHQSYLCGKMSSYNLETAGLPLHPQIKITCKQRPKLCLPY